MDVQTHAHALAPACAQGAMERRRPHARAAVCDTRDFNLEAKGASEGGTLGGEDTASKGKDVLPVLLLTVKGESAAGSGDASILIAPARRDETEGLHAHTHTQHNTIQHNTTSTSRSILNSTVQRTQLQKQAAGTNRFTNRNHAVQTVTKNEKQQQIKEKEDPCRTHTRMANVR